MYREGDHGHSPIHNSLKESKLSRITPNQGREGPLGKPLKKERERDTTMNIVKISILQKPFTNSMQSQSKLLPFFHRNRKIILKHT